jgi:hypothetical protein
MNWVLTKLLIPVTADAGARYQDRKVGGRGVGGQQEHTRVGQQESGQPVVRVKRRGLLYAWRLIRQLPWLRLRYKL